jgi:pimeloyl-ACP methyl ester carboxylesterase
MTVMGRIVGTVHDLAIDDAGEGVPVVLLHGLTATRRYVVMGSKALERSGHRVVAYDARGHGASAPAPLPHEYATPIWPRISSTCSTDRGLDARSSPARRWAPTRRCASRSRRPSGSPGSSSSTPAFHPDHPPGLERWDRLAEGLRSGGVEGFVAAYGTPRRCPTSGARPSCASCASACRSTSAPRRWPTRSRRCRGRRRSTGWKALAGVAAPTVVVASRDDADPGHPLEVGEEYARRIPGARLVVEEEGRSPVAWQGGQLSKVIAELTAAVAR